MQNDDDAPLVERSVGGELEAFEILVGRYQRVLFKVALRMLGDYEDASDATQAAFIKAYQNLRSFDPRFRFFSWIYRILLNECLNARRSRKRHETEEVQDVAFEVAGNGNGSPLDALERSERRHRVQKALLALPGDYRQVVVLRHFAGLSYDDIAATLAIPAKVVKSRLYTARQRLAEMLLVETV
jgi:RNA polymerase sigma-70 factor (ECF subfamily)